MRADVIVDCPALSEKEALGVLEEMSLDGRKPFGTIMIVILYDHDHVALDGLEASPEVEGEGPLSGLPEGLTADHVLALGHGGRDLDVVDHGPAVRGSGLGLNPPFAKGEGLGPSTRQGEGLEGELRGAGSEN
jgi:hypothetical protein